MLSHKRGSTILNHHIGKRHARTRSFGYQSEDEEPRLHEINVRRMTHHSFNYFYETFCALNQTAATNLNQLEPKSPNKYDVHTGEDHECLAVDKKMWHSRCRERLIWTYGLVVRANGDVGWGVIAIRGSCSCSCGPKIHPKGVDR
ncbi:hypothetical protein HPB52_019550 [Rhipicephalus sanguineus]|uniref:Nerve growth factor-related domain-containing protein n=1 Tax=Rhipicephalus sanguineus TaxID=34632 RepID=A0A9D4PGE6_RHISA|nr:hypothetical protein HPB52_019550 [Rhipicephalus sanguineus]